MNIPETWKIARSEPYGTLFNCDKGHPIFLPMGELIPAACPYCALIAAPAPEVEPIGWLGFSPIDELPDFCFHKPADSVMRAWRFRKVYYTTPAPSDELVKAVDLYLKAHDSDKSADKLIALGALRAAHDKVKP